MFNVKESLCCLIVGAVLLSSVLIKYGASEPIPFPLIFNMSFGCLFIYIGGIELCLNLSDYIEERKNKIKRNR